MIPRFFAEKFRNPTGIVGQLVGNVMTRANRFEQGWTVSTLNIQPSDHILEICFGPGVAIQYAAQKATQGKVFGIDYSRTMLQIASKRNAASIKAGRVELRQGNISSLPYPDNSIDKVFTIDCIYFWTDAIASAGEVKRLLKPGGLFAVTPMPMERYSQNQASIPPDIFTVYNSQDIEQILSKAGFRNVRVERFPQPTVFTGGCVLGFK